MILGPMYHWAPTDRRASIEVNGLQPQSPRTVATSEMDSICLGFSPSGAWALSAATLDGEAGAGSWDLWQVHMTSSNPLERVVVRPEFGHILREVQVTGRIGPSRLWLVGTRFRVAGQDPWKLGVAPFPGYGLQ